MAKPVRLRSDIAWSTPDSVTIRGYDLCRDILGVLSLGDMAFLTLTDRLPDPRESAMFNAIAVALVEHGLTPSALVARLTYTGAPEAMQAAVAAGISGLGSVFVGSMETTARLLQEAPDGDLDEVAEALVADCRKRRIPVPGLGHHFHKPADPRAVRLFEIAEAQGFSGRHVALIHAVARRAEVQYGKPLPVNVTGAIGAIASELGFEWKLVRGIGVMARAIGLVGHIREEIAHPMAREIKRRAEEEAMAHHLDGFRRVMNFDASLRGPLAGVKVVDLTRLVAGNMLSLQLGDFGAEVIKVEPPGGDPLRHWQENGKSLHWKAYARNKRSIVLDLRQEAAREALLAILADADVFVENYRPGTLEKMGLAPSSLLARNPGLVIVRISGFGQTGPYAQLPGFGTLVEAMSGFAARNGFADREPVLPPLALADMIAGLSGAMATVIALRARDNGGSGQVIDLSLLEPLVSVLGPEAALYRETGRVLPRAGSGSNTSAPRNVYRCADGKYVALSGSTQAMAMRLFQVIGRADMKTDPDFSTNAARVRNRAAVDTAVGAWFARRSREDALAEMRANGVTVGPVYDASDFEQDPHFRERGIVVDVPDAELGSVQVHAITPRLSETPGVWRRPAPALGEHTAEILAEAGLPDDAIAALRGSEGLA